MIHHQHFFPVVNDQGRLQPVFLAVLNMEGDKPELIARNLERVLTARLRDARFFFDADRQQPLESRVERLEHRPVPQEAGQLRRKGRRASARSRRRSRRRRVRARIRGGAGAHRRPAREGRSRHRHGARDDRAAGHDGRHLRPRGRPARGSLEGHLPSLPAGRRRSRCAADARSAGRRGGHVGGRLARRQARHRGRHVRRGRAARPARAIRTACAAPRRASCGSSSICRS